MHGRYAATGTALLVSLIAALIFATAAILGLNIYLRGRLTITAAIGLPAAGSLVMTLITAMTLKARRHARTGRRRERTAIAAATIIAAAMTPFYCKYVDTLTHRTDLKAAINHTTEAMAHIDTDYAAYANRRIANAPKDLQPILQRQLLPPQAKDIWVERHDWLINTKSDDVWNIYMPANITTLAHAAHKWTDEYTQISTFILAGENPDVTPFTHPATHTRLTTIDQAATDITHPTPTAIATALLTHLLMALAYLLTRRPATAIEGTH